MNYGYTRVATAIPEVKVADCPYNTSRIIELMQQADQANVQIVCFPELAITGYTCGDLFQQQRLLLDAENALSAILSASEALQLTSIVGMPVRFENRLYNTAVVVSRGILCGVIPKSYLPNYGEFYEKRWFASSLDSYGTKITLCNQEVPFGSYQLFADDAKQICFGIELCEDLWTPLPPSSILSMQGANLIFNLSASNEVIGKHTYLEELIRQQSARCVCGYVYASAGYGESTTDLVFAGKGMIAENGSLLSQDNRFDRNEKLLIAEIDLQRLEAERIRRNSFTEALAMVKNPTPQSRTAVTLPEATVTQLTRSINPRPFVPSDREMNMRCEEIFSIQTSGLAKRILHTHAHSMVVGISGGLDSTLALLVCAKTCDLIGIDRSRILGITMPGFGTTDRTYNNAIQLMKDLGVTIKEISIREACEQHFKDIEHDASIHDVTYENTQARERTKILMNMANKHGGMVIGTGDLSELALGWATYNGDQMSMYGVNAGIPKTLVRYLVKWVADTQVDEVSRHTLLDIIDTPVSPELLPADEDGSIAQKTEDIVGPYELHDFFLYYVLRLGYTPRKIFFLATQAFEGTFAQHTIAKWLVIFLRRFFNQQFKRSCMPDGPKVGSINLSPRGDWRMPSDASSASWLHEAEAILKETESN